MLVVQGLAFAMLAAVVVAFYGMLYHRASIDLGITPLRYVTQPPSDLPPAMVGALFDPAMTPDKLAATVLDLVRRGVLEMDVPAHPPYGPDRCDRILRLRRDRMDRLRPFERELVAELFLRVAGRDEVLTSALRMWWAEHPVTSGAVEEILAVRLQQEMVDEGLTDPDAWRHKQVLTAYSISVAFGVLLAWILGPAALLFLALSIVLVAWTQRVSGMSREGARLLERYKGFRRYLLDYGRFQDKPAEAVVVWEEYLPLAIVLGVAGEAEDDVRVGPKFFFRGLPTGGEFPDEAEGLAYMESRRREDPSLPVMTVVHGRNAGLRFTGRLRPTAAVTGRSVRVR